MICKLHLNKAITKLNQLHTSISLYVGVNCTCKPKRTTVRVNISDLVYVG